MASICLRRAFKGIRGGLTFGMLFAVVACADVATPQAASTAATGQNPLQHVAYDTTMTCGDLLARLKGDNKADGGGAIIWLDGVYSGRFGVTVFPAGWALTVSQAIVATCFINVNAARSVLDVLAEVHRQYGGKLATR